MSLFFSFFLIGWSIQQILFLEVSICQYNPLRGSSYIPLPKNIIMKKAVLNIQNKDDCCLAWCMVAAVSQPHGRPNLTSSYPHFSTIFNFEGIEFPVNLKNISKIEKLNNCSINVYGLETFYDNGTEKHEVVGPYYHTQEKRDLHFNLLCITDLDGNSHYCLIKNFSRLVSQQISNHNGFKFFCDSCLQYFESKEVLTNHEQFDCTKVYSKMPTTELIKDKMGNMIPGNILKFQNYSNKLKLPFVIYADFECMLEKLDTCMPNPSSQYVVQLRKHTPYSFAYYIKCSFDNSLSKFELYRGLDAPTVFVNRVEEDVRNIYNMYLKIVKPMKKLTKSQKLEYSNSNVCHICEKTFDKIDIKVRDHCHLSGNYRGTAHSNCNLNFKVPKYIPIFFHNLNYDNHLFIAELAKNNESLDIIPQNKEKYISFNKHILVDTIIENDVSKNIYCKLRFVDSFKFMSTSLEKLAKNLSSDQFVEVKRHFPNQAEFELMSQKGVFPYSFVDSINKLSEPFPARENFYDEFKNEQISEVDYKRAENVWNTFNCQNLGDYSDLYLKTDVLLLTDIFEKFRDICIKTYKLDPAHYLTAPSLSLDAGLLTTKVELELLTDVNMLHFFKHGIRGGVSMCVSKKATANNPFLQNYNPTQPNSYIAYLDATNLYGYCMQQFLPEKNFVWLSDEEIQNYNPIEQSDTSEYGYILEVDIDYPENLHNLHNDFPFCPESLIPPNSKSPKLSPNLLNKRKYIIHYIALKQCIEHGLKLKRIHRVIRFKQSSWLKSYIILNTKMRNSATNDFDRDFFKLMINSIFGKTMENVENRVNIKILNHWLNNGKKPGIQTYVSKPNYKSLTIFTETLASVEFKKTVVYYNKPVYVGFSILEIAKTVMYNFFYNFLKKKYNDNVKLLYTDTDSLILEIYTENFYQDIKNNLEFFDTSNYSPQNIHNMPRNESVVGKFKDEYKGILIRSFLGIAAKTYCVISDNDTVVKKCKGVQKNVVKNNLNENDYISVIDNNSVVRCKMFVFRSRLHTVYTELIQKTALSLCDDKRYSIPLTTNTLAWGHRDIDFHINMNTLFKAINNS